MTRKRLFTVLFSLYCAFVFIQALFFKFTNSPETQHIFNTLDDWAAGLGFAGLFTPPGIFNAYVIGTAELIAAIILLLGVLLKKDFLSGLGGLMSAGVMTGAIFFHLATPLGVDVQGDGGTLFFMACAVWGSGLILAWMHRHSLPLIGGKND